MHISALEFSQGLGSEKGWWEFVCVYVLHGMIVDKCEFSHNSRMIKMIHFSDNIGETLLLEILWPICVYNHMYCMHMNMHMHIKVLHFWILISISFIFPPHLFSLSFFALIPSPSHSCPSPSFLLPSFSFSFLLFYFFSIITISMTTIIIYLFLHRIFRTYIHR